MTMRYQLLIAGAALLCAVRLSAQEPEQPQPQPPEPDQPFEQPLDPLELPTVDPLADRPTLAPPALTEVKEQAMDWLKAQQVKPDVVKDAQQLWTVEDDEQLSGGQLLERLAHTLALGNDDIAALVQLCDGAPASLLLDKQGWLEDEQLAPFARNNLRVLYGRWLAQERFYDEALVQLNGLKPEEVVDPATLLFYQAVANHRLLNKKDGLAAIRRLRSEVVNPPARYDSVAMLMEADLNMLKEETLDHVARLMEDVERRLDLAHAGPVVRKVEDDVVSKLDKLIEELEKQKGGGGGGGGGGPSGNQSSSPANQSGAAAGGGPGNVDQRNLGNRSGWGDLPAKERERALQDLAKDFPSHYRDAIEQYFRKIAAENE